MSNAASYLRKLGELQAQFRGIQEQLHDRLPSLLTGLDKLDTDLANDTDKDFPEADSIEHRIAELRAEVSSIAKYVVEEVEVEVEQEDMGAPVPAAKKKVIKRKKK